MLVFDGDFGLANADVQLGLTPKQDPSDVLRNQATLEDIKMGQERILFVDDEKPLIFVGEKMLRRLGYDVTTRTSSVEALECFRAQPQRFDLVITDQTMPQMTGEEMARQMKQIRPDIPVILCTGFSESFSPGRAQAANIRACLMKPVVMKELAQTLRSIFDDPSNNPTWAETN